MRRSKLNPETARILFAGPCDFVMGATDIKNLPSRELPEVALAGRSNVGKSSLINALTGRNGLAKTSNTPGRTLQLNYFNLGGKLHLVDMPGYGYAKIPRGEQVKIGAFMFDYLNARKNLAMVFVLLDARHELKDSDKEMFSMLDQIELPFRVILTKSDKIKPTELEEKLSEVSMELENYPHADTNVMPTSAEKKSGLEEVRLAIASFAA